MTHEEAMREGMVKIVREARYPPAEGRTVPQALIEDLCGTHAGFAAAYRAEWDRQLLAETPGALLLDPLA